MRAGFNQASVRQHQYPVRALDCYKSMTHHHGCPAFQALSESMQKFTLGPGIERTCRLIQQHNGRIAQQHPGKGQTLPLPLAHLSASLEQAPQQSFIAMRKIPDSRLRTSPVRCLANSWIIRRHRNIAHAYIVLHRHLITNKILKKPGIELIQILKRKLANVHAVKQNTSRARIVQTAEQFNQSCLTAPVFPDQRHMLTGPYIKRQIMQNLSLRFRIGKAHILKADTLDNRAWNRARLGRRTNTPRHGQKRVVVADKKRVFVQRRQAPKSF